MIYIGLFFLALILSYGIKTYANNKAILDIPNHRSSHTIPTPHGGGLAIVIIFFAGLIYFREQVESRLLYALLCAIPIAILGIMDDLFSLSSKVRFIVQSMASLSALYCLGSVSSIDLIFVEVESIYINFFAFVLMIWLTNLYNFLDGIDGYAGMEAVFVGLGLFVFFGNPLGLVIVSASLGFLVFNWHKASLFMGDVGSTTLGFIFAIFLLSDTSHGNIYIWMVLLSLFWFDATITLIRRYRNGEPIFQAHKKHAYQRLVQSGWKHNEVVFGAITLNLIFFTLLYVTDNLVIVFVCNVVTLYAIMKIIDTKKSFIS